MIIVRYSRVKWFGPTFVPRNGFFAGDNVSLATNRPHPPSTYPSAVGAVINSRRASKNQFPKMFEQGATFSTH